MQAIQKAMLNHGVKVNIEAVNYDGEYQFIISHAIIVLWLGQK